MSGTNVPSDPVGRRMADIEQEIADCIGAIYEAATADSGWFEVGLKLSCLLDAPAVSLNTAAAISGYHNLLMPHDEEESRCLKHYEALNPYAAQAKTDYKNNRSIHIGTARIGDEIVPESIFISSEYYNDFANTHGRRYMIGGILGIDSVMPIAFFRPVGHHRFDTQDKRLLNILLPHFQRALEMRHRLGNERQLAQSREAALETLQSGIAIVDSELRVHFLNQAAQHFLNAADAPLATICSGPHGRGIYLTALSRREMEQLRQLVRNAASGGPGGAMRACGDGADPCALIISPLPQSLAPVSGGSGVVAGMALIFLQPLPAASTPPVGLLRNIFELSPAEAEVAAALSGGTNAEEVACERGVSLATVRSQIRSILAKSDCGNLRDFERIMAKFALITPTI